MRQPRNPCQEVVHAGITEPAEEVDRKAVGQHPAQGLFQENLHKARFIKEVCSGESASYRAGRAKGKLCGR